MCMRVCICVAGLIADKEGTVKRERQGDFDESADSCWPAAGREGKRARRTEGRPA